MNTNTHLHKTAIVGKPLNKSLSLMERPFVKHSIHHDRNLFVSFHPESAKEFNQRFPVFNPGITAKQKGATLFTALIFLIMLSLLGVNAAQMSTMEERMSGNTRNRDLAFQAAEAALKYVEQNLNIGENIRTLNFTGTTAGLRTFDACLPNTADYWNESGAKDCGGTTRNYSWSSTTARTPNHSLLLNKDVTANATLQPLYVVEKMPNVGTTERYRVTAHGLGGDSTAVVILQAMFSFTP